MKRILKVLTIIIIVALTVLPFIACSNNKDAKKIMYKVGPFTNTAGSETITINKNGTYDYSVDRDYQVSYDPNTDTREYEHFTAEIKGGTLTEILKYEYEYKAHTNLDLVNKTKKGWIAIYKLEGISHYFKQTYGGEMYLAVDDDTKEYGVVNIFQYNSDPTQSYLDSLRPDINGVNYQKNGMKIPLNEVGSEVYYVQKTHRNEGGHYAVLKNQENLNK